MEAAVLSIDEERLKIVFDVPLLDPDSCSQQKEFNNAWKLLFSRNCIRLENDEDEILHLFFESKKDLHLVADWLRQFARNTSRAFHKDDKSCYTKYLCNSVGSLRAILESYGIHTEESDDEEGCYMYWVE